MLTDTVEIYFSKRANSIAGCLPNVQGMSVDSLWDSGATGSLVTRETALVLEERGAVRSPCARSTRIVGIGDGEMLTAEQLEMTITFSDGLSRKLTAFIVPVCPHSLIIGLNFQQEEKISFHPTGDGHFELVDDKHVDHPVIYSSKSKPLGHVSVNSAINVNFAKLSYGDDETEQVCVNYLKEHPLTRRASEKEFDSVEKGLKGLKKENRELIELLNRVKIAKVSEAELEKRLANSKFAFIDNSSQTDRVFVNAAGETKLEVPKCDFPELQADLEELIHKHSRVFSSSSSDVGKSTSRRVTLKLRVDECVNDRCYRTPLKLREVLRKLIDDLLEAGVIELCKSNEFNSPCLLVPKKPDQLGGQPGYRLVVDYRRLNKIIENVVYPMPRIQDLLATFLGCKVFSNVDIRHAFFTIELNEDSRYMTAFSCEFGKYQFKFLPQGLKVSPALFQERITDDLRGLERTKPYMDDILSGDPTPPQQLVSLDRLLTRLGDKGYKLKLSKCLFLRIRVTFLGSDVTEHGIAISEDKKIHARQMTAPKTMADVKSTLGFCSFLRAHVPYYCDVAHPIQELLSIKDQTKNMSITPFWTELHELSLETIKKLLCSEEVLAFPDGDKPFILYTDASGKAMSAVLFQKDERGALTPIGYWAKAFRGAQKNWAALVKEARAVYEAAQHFEVFLVASENILKCDHKPLERFLEQRTKNDMVNRWSLDIQHLQLKFEWVCSEENLSDCLSRMIRLFPENALELFEEHKEIDHDFPSKPKLDTRSQLTQVKVPVMDNDTATAAVADVLPQAEQVRRQLTDGEEAQLLGVTSELTIRRITHLSNEQVKSLQSKCNYCRRIIDSLDTMRPENGVFTLKDGILYRVYDGTSRGSEGLPGLVLVVPNSLILSVIVNTHKELKHAGRDTMIRALRTRCYWKGLHKHVKEFVRNCKICQRVKIKANEYSQLRIKPPAGPGVRMAVDLWKCSHGTCLTAIDLYSQYPYAVSISDARAETVCDAMQEIFTSVQPLEIISDNGPEFKSFLFAELLTERKIKHIRIAPRSPESNGVLERFHRWLNSVITHTIHFTSEKQFVPAVRAAIETYRKLPHTQTGETPMFLHTAQEPLYCIDHLLPTLARGVHYTEEGRIDLDHLRAAHALGRKNLCLARLKNKNKGKMTERSLRVGDKVYLLDHDSTKIDPKWAYGYRIISFNSDRTVELEHSKTKRHRVANVRHLRLVDPVAELLESASLDAYPGSTKLYLTQDALEDLDWESMADLPPLAPELVDKAMEISRDRTNDLFEQEPPRKRTKEDDTTQVERTVRRSNRRKRRPVWFTAHFVNIDQ